MNRFDKLFDQFSTIKVAIVGDIMLDTYWQGNVNRISPEAPVPVVSLNKKEYRIGGAGNVALNTTALNAQTAIFSVMGHDDDANTLEQLFNNNNITTKHLCRSRERITTNKVRVVGHNQQMLRIDSEVTTPLTETEEIQLLANFKKYVQEEKPSLVILEDYNKGVLTEKVIRSVIAVARENNMIITVDPKRDNFFAYKNVDIFKPNLKEVKDALHLSLKNIDENALANIHESLCQQLQHRISLITLSERGLFYKQEKESATIPTHVRNIADVSGAGDTVIAVASLVYTTTRDMHLAASVANVAGGLVCEELGTVAINQKKLLQECNLLLQ